MGDLHGSGSRAHDEQATAPHDHDHGPHDHGPHDHGPDDHGPDDHGPHDHEHPTGLRGRARELFVPHSHDAGDSVDAELKTSSRGMRALWVSFVALMVTTLLQAVVVALSGSVALLGDTLHNAADALTAVPLAVAFTLGRRAPTRRYTYGYGRAEDLAGLVVVVLIAVSAAFAGYEAVRRLLDPAEVRHLGLVAAAGVIGFVGNELVARYRITVGRDIGSAALVADGLHARTDGFTSLAVVLGAAGVALGLPLADPLVGLLITVAILSVLRSAAREVFARLMDAVDPEVLTAVERTLVATPGVLQIGDVRVRWIGHALRAECEVVVDDELSVTAGHEIAHDAEDRLLRDVRRLTAALVHAGPSRADPARHAVRGPAPEGGAVRGQSRASTSR